MQKKKGGEPHPNWSQKTPNTSGRFILDYNHVTYYLGKVVRVLRASRDKGSLTRTTGTSTGKNPTSQPTCKQPDLYHYT